MRARLAGSIGVFLVVLSLSLSRPARREAVKWDYVRQPARVTEDPPAQGDPFGLCAASAFDGFGTQGATPARTRTAREERMP